MQISPKFVFVAALAAAVAGCAPAQVQRAENTDPVGSAFSKALYSEYLGLASSERSNGQSGKANMYAFRAIAAAKGKEFMPDLVEPERLPDKPAGELRGARNRLIQALERGARGKTPGDSAKAQVMFDCWLEEQERGGTSSAFTQCRNGFLAAMTDVENSLAPKSPSRKQVTESFIVYFGLNSAKLSPEAGQTIVKAVNLAKKIDAKRVLLFGFTDRSGAIGYNAELSEKRAEAVAAQIKANGVATDLIGIMAFGEATPAVETPDGKTESSNRRVEITVSN